MPRTWIYCVFLIAATLGLSGCAPASADFETPLYMEQSEAAQKRVRTWPGPAVLFEVTDLRDPALLGRRELPDGGILPQTTLYSAEREYTYPIDQALEELLAQRSISESERTRIVEVCIVRYDFAEREIAKDVFQHEVYVQYDFRGDSAAEPCEGAEQFYYAGWGVWDAGGETPDRARSNAAAALIDHILRHYISRAGALVPSPAEPIDFVLEPTRARWAPSEEQISSYKRMRGVQSVLFGFFTFYAPYMGGMNTEPYPLQDRNSVRLATASMLRDLLQPQLQVIETIVDASEGTAARPRLLIEPVYIGIAGEEIALVRVRARLIWPNGAAIFDQVMDGACEASPVSRCTVYEQIDSIAQRLRNQLPELIVRARATPPQPPVAQETGGNSEQPAPQPETPVESVP